MTTRCKVCDSEHKDLIESMILNGESNNAIAIDMQTKGMAITHASINRHKTKHMPEHKEKIKELTTPKNNTKYDRNDNVNAINAIKIFEEVKTKAVNGIDYMTLADNYMMIHLLLNRIVNNQLAIAVDLQERYMNGESKYPHEQIKGLQIVQDLMQKFEIFNRNSFQHYNDMFNGVQKTDYLYKKGTQAKLNMPVYNKGDIFRLSLKHKRDDIYDAHNEKFTPKNPYKFHSLNRDIEQSFNAFDMGIANGTNDIEKLDVELFENIFTLPEKEFDKMIKKLSSGNYDYQKIDKELDEIWDKIPDKSGFISHQRGCDEPV